MRAPGTLVHRPCFAGPNSAPASTPRWGRAAAPHQVPRAANAAARLVTHHGGAPLLTPQGSSSAGAVAVGSGGFSIVLPGLAEQGLLKPPQGCRALPAHGIKSSRWSGSSARHNRGRPRLVCVRPSAQALRVLTAFQQCRMQYLAPSKGSECNIKQSIPSWDSQWGPC